MPQLSILPKSSPTLSKLQYPEKVVTFFPKRVLDSSFSEAMFSETRRKIKRTVLYRRLKAKFNRINSQVIVKNFNRLSIQKSKSGQFWKDQDTYLLQVPDCIKNLGSSRKDSSSPDESHDAPTDTQRLRLRSNLQLQTSFRRLI